MSGTNFGGLTPYSFSVDILLAAKWINCFFFGINISLIGWTIFQISGSKGWAVFGTLLGCISESLIDTHLWALTEPPYFTWTLISLLCLNSDLSHEDKKQLWLILSAVFASLALITRFAGIALLAACITYLLFISKHKLSRKIRSSFIFLTIATLPANIFLIINYLFASTLTDDPGFAWHPPTLPQWQQFSKIILNWFLPDFVVENISGKLGLVFLVLLLTIAAVIIIQVLQNGQPTDGKDRLLFSLHLLYLLAYIDIFLVTVFLWRRITPADSRLIAPIFISSIILLISMIGLFWRTSTRQWQFTILVLTGILLFAQGLRYRNIFISTPREAYGLAAPK